MCQPLLSAPIRDPQRRRAGQSADPQFPIAADRVAVDLARVGAIHMAMSGYHLLMGRASLRATGTISADAEQDRAG